VIEKEQLLIEGVKEEIIEKIKKSEAKNKILEIETKLLTAFYP